jgi:hypothetical protein
MPDTVHWDTRLEVKLGTDTITPLDSFTPTFNTPVQVLHSVEADNVGFVVQPHTFTFTMTAKAIGSVVATLTALARDRKKFSIGVAEKRGTDWTFKSIAFNDCLITSVNPSNVVIDGVPVATFNCICLDAIEEAK